MKLTVAERRTIRNRLNAHRVQDNRKGRPSDGNCKVSDWIEQWEWQEGKCFYTGIELSVDTASLDRIDCSLPHTPGNCVLVLNKLNFSRGNKDILTFCKYLDTIGLLKSEGHDTLERIDTMKSTYQQYCQAIADTTGATGTDLRERIRRANILSYTLLFNDANIRQRDMTNEQLQTLEQHRREMISLLYSFR